MKILALNCNQCGAPLEVPEKARFVTCSFCNVRLQVQRQGAASYTEVLEEMSGDLAEIKRNTAIQRLDQEWMLEREAFMRVAKDGSRYVPSGVGSPMSGIGMAVFGVFFIVLTGSNGAPAFFPFFGVVFVGVALVVGISGMKRARAYARAHARYEDKRRTLMAGESGEERVQ